MTLLAVPCEGADVLALFDDEGSPLGEIPVGSHPVHAVVESGSVFVATMGERSITAVDSDGEATRIETGVLGPAHIVSAGRRLLVPCTAGDAVAVINSVTALLEGRVPTGAEPHDVAVVGDWAIAGSRTDGVLTVFDPVTRRVRNRLEVPDPDTARIQGIDAARRDTPPATAYAVDQGNERVLLVDSDDVMASARVGTDPYDATVTVDRVYVPSRGDDTVHEFVPDLSESVVHETADGPEGVLVIDGEPWVFHRDSPILLSLKERELALPAPALAATELPDGSVAFSHYDDDAISLVDVRESTIKWTSETPAYPFESVAI